MPFWNTEADTRADKGRRSRSSVDNIRTVTGADFDDVVLAMSGPVAVEFMSYGCVHCRAIEPILQEVAGTIGASETIFRVNLAVEPELAARYEVEGTPTFIMFSHGQEVGRSVGPQPNRESVLSALTQPFA